MRWFLNRKMEYYPFDTYLAGHGYTREMKRDFGWSFKNVFFYYVRDLEYSYRSVDDMESLKKYYRKRFNAGLVHKFSLMIEQRSEKMLSITKKCFGKETNSVHYLPKLFQSVYDLLAVFQLPELAQYLIPEANRRLLKKFGLSRETAVKKLLVAEKIWRGRLGKKLGLPPKQALMLLPSEVLDYAQGGRLPRDFYKRKRAVILFSKGKAKVFWNKKAEEIYNRYRAFSPRPGIFSFWQKGKELKKINLKKINLSAEILGKNIAPGTIVERDGQILVATGLGTIEIQEIQIEGKKPVPIKNFINGYPNFVGSVLN